LRPPSDRQPRAKSARDFSETGLPPRQASPTTSSWQSSPPTPKAQWAIRGDARTGFLSSPHCRFGRFHGGPVTADKMNRSEFSPARTRTAVPKLSQAAFRAGGTLVYSMPRGRDRGCAAPPAQIRRVRNSSPTTDGCRRIGAGVTAMADEVWAVVEKRRLWPHVTVKIK